MTKILTFLKPLSKSNNDINLEAPPRALTATEKRLYHNALERKRRELINFQFYELHSAVPSIFGVKASRSQVLTKATEFIHMMKRKVKRYELEIEGLKHQNKQLENELRSLQDLKNENDHSETPLKRITFGDDDSEVLIDDDDEESEST